MATENPRELSSAMPTWFRTSKHGRAWILEVEQEELSARQELVGRIKVLRLEAEKAAPQLRAKTASARAKMEAAQQAFDAAMAAWREAWYAEIGQSFATQNEISQLEAELKRTADNAQIQACISALDADFERTRRSFEYQDLDTGKTQVNFKNGHTSPIVRRLNNLASIDERLAAIRHARTTAQGYALEPWTSEQLKGKLAALLADLPALEMREIVVQ